MKKMKKIIKKEDHQVFIDWCTDQKLLIKKNWEVFFVNEEFLIKPEFIVNSKIYVDIVQLEELTPQYLGFCEQFSKSFGAIMIIPYNILNGFNTITKKTIESRFNFKF